MTSSEARFVPSPYIEWAISKVAQDETGKRQYYRPIYSIHKWWARRPGSLFRSILILATESEEVRKKLFVKNYDGEISPASSYFGTHDLSGWIILDPFMGGGTTLVEANRLGAKVIGCDINPVAFWVVRESLKPLDTEKLNHYFEVLERTAGEKIRALYRTRCISCGHGADILYVFWIRTIQCIDCGHTVLLHKRALLNEGASRNRPLSKTNPATVFCPNCRSIHLWRGEPNHACPSCGVSFNPREGFYNQGYYRCPYCNSTKNLLETIRAGRSLEQIPIAIEYWCASCKSRQYKPLDADDQQILAQAEAVLRQSDFSWLIPDTFIPQGTSSRRWIQHGFTRYRDVFSARQLVAFSYLIEAIRAIPEIEYQFAFYTIFSNMLEYNNLMTPYNYPHRKLHHLFNYHALPLTTTPVENAVWGVGEEGAGTFVNCYRRYVNAKRYCAAPYEKYRTSQGEVITIQMSDERIEACMVDTFDELKTTSRGALLMCQDSAKLPQIPDKSVDLVVTDPPYYDSIHYSELSNFFYVWLAKQIPLSCFQTPLVPSDKEAVVNKGLGKDEDTYRDLLTRVFRECHRVLKDEGRLIFTFHHTKWHAWWVILSAVWEGGFRIIDFFPVQSEYRVNPHIRNKQALDMDLVLICQKREVPFEALSLSPAEALERATTVISQHSNGSRNGIFLHFVGELLRSASCSTESTLPSEEWFRTSLELFDTISPSVEERTSTYTPLQMTLFEQSVPFHQAEDTP
ncbi:MAG: DNA methyltransferase [Fimbriimonadales bacterium]